jgi:cytochrome c biogenesis factor
MLARINILAIIKDHFKTLKSLNSTKNRISWQDSILFIVTPIVIAVGLVYKDLTFEEQLGNLIAAISIFGGFLFNLLAIIYSQFDKIEIDANKEDNELKKRFVKEIHTNISFCIVLSILIVLTLLLSTIDIPLFNYDWLLKKIIIGVNYFLMSLFLLTLTMVLNRVYILLKKEREQ